VMFPKAVIDTGPLFSVLVINYDLRLAELGRSPRFTSELADELRGLAAQRRLLALLSSIRDKLTTPHVIAELGGLGKSRLKLYGADRIAFWRTSIDLLIQWQIDERLVRLLDLAAEKSFQACLPDIGTTDTALIQLALQHECVLITEDERTLAREAWRQGVDCRLVTQLIPLGP
jgi:rRNA-processing protein FCF1